MYQSNIRIPFLAVAAFLSIVVALLGATPAFADDKPDDATVAKIAALDEQKKEAMDAVRKIVNQPVTAYARRLELGVTRFQGGWFHPGASTPDFNHVDIRQTQDLNYAAHPWVSSDLNPNVVYRGTDLEFNSNTKYFYTDRAVPKKKLTDAEMQEINRLYRIIGKCQSDAAALAGVPAQPQAAADSGTTTNDTETVVYVRQPVPRENKIKAAIYVSLVLLAYVIYKVLVRKRS